MELGKQQKHSLHELNKRDSAASVCEQRLPSVQYILYIGLNY